MVGHVLTRCCSNLSTSIFPGIGKVCRRAACPGRDRPGPRVSPFSPLVAACGEGGAAAGDVAAGDGACAETGPFFSAGERG